MLSSTLPINSDLTPGATATITMKAAAASAAAGCFSVSTVADCCSGWRNYLQHSLIRYDRRWNGKKRHKCLSPLSASADASATTLFSSQDRVSHFYQEVLKSARERFTQEISFQSTDKDVSIAKALLYVAAEDEIFKAFNQDMDTCFLMNERGDASVAIQAEEWDSLEAFPLAGRSISEWLSELDTIAKEVEAELVLRDIGCYLVEVLKAVNVVLFESRGFKRFHALLDSKLSYLHAVLKSGHGSATILRIIYIEVCRRLGVKIVGSRVGEEFLIWPQNGNPEELFRVYSGHSLFAIVNGSCVEDPRSKASDLNSSSLSGLEIATNRDIIGISLANLIRLHWKRASRMNHGLMLTSPLRPIYDKNEKYRKIDESKAHLLQPQDLRLAIMASERLLILQPHNWALRRDHGMLLYFDRKYGEAVQELSICMAFAPTEEAEILEPFVEKLHLLRLESSWKSSGHADQLAIS